MGKANRERRRIKQKARRRAHHAPSGARAGGPTHDAQDWLGRAAGTLPPPSVPEQVAELVQSCLIAMDHQDPLAIADGMGQLAGREAPDWRRAAERTLDLRLRTTLTELWRHGWQPADVLRITTRRLQAGHLELIRAVMAAELSRYSSATVDPRWAPQLAEADVRVWWPAQLNAVQACVQSRAQGWGEMVRTALELLHLLLRLPRLQLLTAVPGTAVAATHVAQSTADERILARVRALLAKAESTTFPAEAETFTAGAQALMARHSIDHALLTATGRAPADEPTARRLGVDNPYEAPKAALLDAIASANRCRSVWSKEMGFCTVVGFPTDLDTVEVLFTSLLVQATAAMTGHGSRTDRGGRSRTRSFRQSFLVSYSARIRERLTEASREQTEQAASEPGGENLLPVLASREDDVQQATDRMFPALKAASTGSAWDGEGWASGRAAADLASLHPGGQLTD
jgi:hypothetical protein